MLSNEHDLSYIENMVTILDKEFTSIDHALQAGLTFLADISKDIAVMKGPDFIITVLEMALKTYIIEKDRYVEYHELFQDLTSIKEL